METILYIVHTESNGSLPKIALEGLTAAQELSKNLAGSTFNVGLIGEKIDSAANSISDCDAKFFGVSGSDFAISRYGSDVAAIEALIQKAKATLVLAPSTARFAKSFPGAAFRLKGRIDTHISALCVANGGVQVQRWYYRQRMSATLTRKTRPWFLLLDSGIASVWKAVSGSASIENVPVALPEGAKQTSVLGIKTPSSDAQTIRPEAELLFVAGAGWTKKQSDGQPHVKDAEKLILNFLTQTKASLGSSKSLVDLRGEGQEVFAFMSHLNQVGQTGSTPRHPKGLATCCHGEEPHVVGWRFINERRAVNLDPNCGWARGKADVLYVADAFKVVEEINKLLV